MVNVNHVLSDVFDRKNKTALMATPFRIYNPSEFAFAEIFNLALTEIIVAIARKAWLHKAETQQPKAP